MEEILHWNGKGPGLVENLCPMIKAVKPEFYFIFFKNELYTSLREELIASTYSLAQFPGARKG